MSNGNRVTVEAEGLARRMAVRLGPAIESAAMAIAAVIQDETAPYPRARPRRAGKGYYVRGRGSFSASGKLIRSSEMLNRRWDIRSISLGAELRNTASYSGDVHGRTQTRLHAQTGWIKAADAIERIKRRGEITQIVMQAIQRAMGGQRP
jgi:hypothetical protein